MASPKLLKQPKLLVPTDPNNVSAIYANNVIGISIRDGIAHVTLGVVRANHCTKQNESGDENVIVERFAMPLKAMDGLVEGYRQLVATMKMGPQSTGKPN